MELVRAFVKSAVNGRRVEVVRNRGALQSMVFRLCRDVDSFELAPEYGGDAQVVSLMDVASIQRGNSAQAKRDFAALLPRGLLDGFCIIVELLDGRCLVFRFVGSETTADAAAFVRCMLIFKRELQRQR